MFWKTKYSCDGEYNWGLGGQERLPEEVGFKLKPGR